MFEQCVRHHFDFVKVNTFVQLGEPRRENRRDEMHIMPAFREVAAEFGADDPAAAVGWIDCDADVYRAPISLSVLSKRNRNSFCYKTLLTRIQPFFLTTYTIPVKSSVSRKELASSFMMSHGRPMTLPFWRNPVIRSCSFSPLRMMTTL